VTTVAFGPSAAIRAADGTPVGGPRSGSVTAGVDARGRHVEN
jgi:hypothetical protein